MSDKKPEQIRKITLKNVMGGNPDIEVLVKAPNKRIDLCTIYGIARRFKPDESEKGQFIRFYGQFKAVNLKTGEVFQAGQVILPGAAQDALWGAMSGTEGAQVSFAIKVGVKYSPTAIAKYEYTVESQLPPQENDPLKALEVQAGYAKLEAPKKAA